MRDAPQGLLSLAADKAWGPLGMTVQRSPPLIVIPSGPAGTATLAPEPAAQPQAQMGIPGARLWSEARARRGAINTPVGAILRRASGIPLSPQTKPGARSE